VNAIIGALDLTRYSPAELEALEALVARAVGPVIYQSLDSDVVD
jgi:hypothetical protein